jgi:hypothetical protein
MEHKKLMVEVIAEYDNLGQFAWWFLLDNLFVTLTHL